MNPIRFVGGSYHGRCMAVPYGQHRMTLAVLRGKPTDYFEDKSVFEKCDFESEHYYKTDLTRQTAHLMVRETVMLFEKISPRSDDAVQRWQELRPL
jgi:hypothetical protein